MSGIPAESDPMQYSFLCPDGHLQPINTVAPCIWVAKPWPAIAVQRSYAEQVQHLLEKLSHDEENSWQSALLSLLETYHVNVTTLDTSIPIDNYLDQAVGFQSAYSFATCNPPRSVVYCTTTLIQHYKCSWLQEVSSVYGIEPNIQCIRAESVDRCMEDTKHNLADVILVDQDERIKAETIFFLKPLLFEYAIDLHDRYVTVAVVKANSNIYHLKDLKGRSACFPKYEGAAYLSALDTLRNLNFIGRNSCLSEYFQIINNNLNNSAEEMALQCLAEDKGHVAFVSSNTFKKLTEGRLSEKLTYSLKLVKLLCLYGRSQKHEEDLCYLNWTPRGHLMISNRTGLLRKNEIFTSLRQMEKLFGKHYKSHTIPFTLFGPFDQKNNIMFRDQTDELRLFSELQNDKFPRLMESAYSVYSKEMCSCAGFIFPIFLSNMIPSLIVYFITTL